MSNRATRRYLGHANGTLANGLDRLGHKLLVILHRIESELLQNAINVGLGGNQRENLQFQLFDEGGFL
jgi:hypothetical protein